MRQPFGACQAACRSESSCGGRGRSFCRLCRSIARAVAGVGAWFKVRRAGGHQTVQLIGSKPCTTGRHAPTCDMRSSLIGMPGHRMSPPRQERRLRQRSINRRAWLPHALLPYCRRHPGTSSWGFATYSTSRRFFDAAQRAEIGRREGHFGLSSDLALTTPGWAKSASMAMTAASRSGCPGACVRRRRA